MGVFVTGATGFIGSAIVRDLISAGHEVTGLARSNESARRLEAAGAKATCSSIENLKVLRREAAKAEGVIHTAFFHALSHAGVGTRLRVLLGGRPVGIVSRFMTAAVEADRRAIETLGAALADGGRPLVIAFPTMAMAPGRLAVETDAADPRAVGGLRARSENAVKALAAGGVRASIIRLPPSVHDDTRQGLVTQLIGIARKKKVSACIGTGQNRWSAVHRQDAASLFRLALEQGTAGAHYHAVGEEPLAFRKIAEAIGRHLGVPVKEFVAADAAKHFGWLAPFIGTDNPVSSQITRDTLGWAPQHSGLLTDIATALRDGLPRTSPQAA
jgi:nucleoside-diphosphate-sugar epimerase